MSSKRRVRASSCTSKIRHSNREDSIVHIKKLVNSANFRDGYLHPYKCNYCGGWHVGHTMDLVKKIMKSKRNE